MKINSREKSAASPEAGELQRGFGSRAAAQAPSPAGPWGSSASPCSHPPTPAPVSLGVTKCCCAREKFLPCKGGGVRPFSPLYLFGLTQHACVFSAKARAARAANAELQQRRASSVALDAQDRIAGRIAQKGP